MLLSRETGHNFCVYEGPQTKGQLSEVLLSPSTYTPWISSQT